MRRSRPDQDVYVVTDAARSRREDIAHRQRVYLIKMAVRTLSLVLAIVLFALGVPWPFLLALIVVSTVLPWMSVVVANAGPIPERRPPPSFHTPEPPNALGRGRSAEPR